MSAQRFSAQALAKPLMMSVNTLRLELARAEVIEEEERLGAEHGDVVDAMVDQVLADGVVPVHGKGDLELGADAIHAGDQHRLAVSLRTFSANRPPNPPTLPSTSGPMRRGQQLRQRGFDPVAQINIHAGAGVCFLFHWAAING